MTTTLSCFTDSSISTHKFSRKELGYSYLCDIFVQVFKFIWILFGSYDDSIKIFLQIFIPNFTDSIYEVEKGPLPINFSMWCKNFSGGARLSLNYQRIPWFMDGNEIITILFLESKIFSNLLFLMNFFSTKFPPFFSNWHSPFSSLFVFFRNDNFLIIIFSCEHFLHSLGNVKKGVGDLFRLVTWEDARGQCPSRKSFVPLGKNAML